jgi:hypothetical protein
MRELLASAASLNVPPGRGTGPAPWADCGVWLKTVADIVVEFLPSEPTSPFATPN